MNSSTKISGPETGELLNGRRHLACVAEIEVHARNVGLVIEAGDLDRDGVAQCVRCRDGCIGHGPDGHCVRDVEPGSGQQVLGRCFPHRDG